MLTEYFEIELQTSQQRDSSWQNLLVPINRTVEVMSLMEDDICPIPGVNSSLRGIINQRGRLVWVLNLQSLLGWEKAEERPAISKKLTAIVLMRGESSSSEAKLAGVVSALKGIVSLDSPRILPFPTTAQGATLETPFLTGMATVDSSTFAVLDVNAVFQTLQTSVVTTQTVKS
jgi:twitching motility protein PilI